MRLRRRVKYGMQCGKTWVVTLSATKGLSLNSASAPSLRSG
jgi:hypothetical protein